MTQNNNVTTKHHQQIPLTTTILLGAGIALTLIALFLSGGNDPHPDWPKYWYIRPLIIVPLAGALGGAIFYILDQLSSNRGLNKTIAIILGVIIYVIGLWLGFVLGLDGTLWD